MELILIFATMSALNILGVYSATDPVSAEAIANLSKDFDGRGHVVQNAGVHESLLDKIVAYQKTNE